jgi:hypothetical protein
MYSYSNTKNNVLFFQYIIVVILIIIVSFIYYAFATYNKNNKIIDNDLQDIDKDLKKLSTESYYKYLDPKNLENSRNINKIKNNVANIPTVDDIVSAIFPGRNTMILSGGNIQNVNRSNDINTYTSDYAIYQPIQAFPVEPDDPLTIPQPLTSSNPLSRSDNTYNNNFMNTQTTDTSLTRMNQGITSSQYSSTGNPGNNPASSTKSKNP